MSTDFQNLVIQMVKKEGIEVLKRLGRCKELLQRYADKGFKREICIFLISLEAGYHQELFQSTESKLTKAKLIQQLQNDYGIMPMYAEEIITLLETIIDKQEWKDEAMITELEKTAQQGDIHSQYELGLLYERQKEYETAIHWLKEAAKQGLALYEQTGKSTSGIQKASGSKASSLADTFVRIKGGIFIMGSPLSEPEREPNEAQHHVKVSSFYLSKYQVTQREYETMMGTNPSEFKGDNLPVEYISWYDAIVYCNKRSQAEGLLSAYTINKSRNDPNNNNEFDSNKWLITWNQNANGYRLPTEAEWEYA